MLLLLSASPGRVPPTGEQNCETLQAKLETVREELERTKAKYGERGERYVHIEVGHAAQNICLQATALGLVTVGTFDDARVASIAGLAKEEAPLYIIPVGRMK